MSDTSCTYLKTLDLCDSENEKFIYGISSKTHLVDFYFILEKFKAVINEKINAISLVSDIFFI